MLSPSFLGFGSTEGRDSGVEAPDSPDCRGGRTFPLGKLRGPEAPPPVAPGPELFGAPPGVGLNPLPPEDPLARRGFRLDVGRLPPAAPPSRGVAPLLGPLLGLAPPMGLAPSGRNLGPNGP